MRSLLVALPVVLAGPAFAAPGGGATIDESDQPRVLLAEKPLRTKVWADVDLATVLPAANTNKVFLNFCDNGCLVTRASVNDSRQNRSTVPNVSQGNLSAFSRGDTVKNNVISCVRDVFAPFGVEIVTTDPGPNANHFEIMIGGTPGQLGLGGGTGGISPYNCSVEYISNSIVFVFDVWGTDVEDICATAAQELAHSFRLDHVTDASDPLTYYGYSGRKRFKNAQVQCGSDCFDFDNNPATPNTTSFGRVCTGTTINMGAQNHVCECTGQNTQNSVTVITSLFGSGTPTPPIVDITQPKTGDNVQPGFAVAATATDDNGISMVELRVNGMPSGTSTQFPYVFNAPATLADGTHTVEVTAYDNFGASAKKTVQVIIGKPCGKPSDCPNDTDTCVGGRCVPGSGVQGGLGTTCATNEECASGQCATAEAESYCVEICTPGEGQCPSGFTCQETAPEMGVCWPGESGGCNVGGGGSLAIGLSFLALLWSRRRRP